MRRSRTMRGTAGAVALWLTAMTAGPALASECDLPGQAGQEARVEKGLARARRAIEQNLRHAIDIERSVARERLEALRLQADRLADIRVAIDFDRLRDAVLEIPEEIEVVWKQGFEVPDDLEPCASRRSDPSLAHQVVDAFLSLTGKAGVMIGSLIKATAAVFRHGKEMFA